MIYKEKLRDVHARLTDNELEMLKERIEGYGFLADCARRTGLHVNTIRKILEKGYGMADTINKIRNILLRENSTY